MENKAKEKKATEVFNKIKNGGKNVYLKWTSSSAGKQRAITYLAYGLIIAVVVLSALFNVLLDINNFNLTKFITNLSFNVAIAILTMILSMRDGDLTNESARSGDYYDIRQAFKQAIHKLVNRDMFRQYCDVIYSREKEDYVMTELAKVNIYEKAYLYVSDDDFEILKKEPKKCLVNDVEKPLEELTDAQAMALEYFRSGKFTFDKLDYSFFTSSSVVNSYSKQAKRVKHQRKVRVYAILYRIGILMITGLIFALVAVSPYENANAVKNAIFDTTSRLLVMFSSMFMGYTIAHDQMKENIDALEYKIETINQYLDDKETGVFVPKDYDEVILEKINKLEEERKKQREEEERKKQEAINNVVDAEEVKQEENKQNKEEDILATNEEDDYYEIEMTESQLLELKKNNKK